MKKVLLLFGKYKWKESRPFNNKNYQYSYEYFYTLCKKSGVQMYRSSYEWYDYKKHIFKYSWIYEGENANWKRVYNIKPDLIFDKTKATPESYYKKEFIRKKYRFFNNPEFTKLIDDKLTTSLLFEKWCKKSWLIENKKDISPSVLSKIKSGRVVLKPLVESGGKGVQILRKKDVAKKAKIKSPYLVQEFIDSSAGVPGFSKGIHDLRLVVINKKIIYSYIREPKTGSLLANCSQGGILKIVPLKNIPKSVYPIIDHANRTFDTFFPRLYSIDLMFDKKKNPWVIELNAMPGLNLCAEEERPHLLKLYTELIKIFIRMKLKTE